MTIEYNLFLKFPHVVPPGSGTSDPKVECSHWQMAVRSRLLRHSMEAAHEVHVHVTEWPVRKHES